MAIDKVRPLKLEDPESGGTETDQFPTSLDPSEDHVQCAGVVLEDATHSDENVRVWRDGADLKLQDTNNPSPATLTELRASSELGRAVMEVSGAFVYVGDGELVLKV